MKKQKRKLIINAILIGINSIIMIFSFVSLWPNYGWLSFTRRTASIERISNPTAIFIGAGNEEHYAYIKLGGIDVSQSTYKDYVFCIRGLNIRSYKLQLAYTTNNQFSFEIYPATSGDIPSGVDPIGTVEYETHGDNVERITYYTTGDKLEGSFKNLDPSQAPKEMGIIDNGNYYYDETYEGYEYLNEYAMPLYWQTGGIAQNVIGEFCDYYILRVIWTEDTVNNKETDIVYITAKNVGA